MTTAPIRTAAKRRLFELVGAQLTGVQVTYAEPAMFEPLCVWITNVTGPMRPAALKAGRKPRFDEFTVGIHCMAVRSDTNDFSELDEAVEALWAEVDSILANSPTLAVNGSGLPGLLYATTSNVDGPNNGMAVREEKVVGFMSEIIATIQFTSRLT